MTSVHSYAQQKTNNQAMANLLKDNGQKYDASLAALFSRFIGAYPIGSCVLCEEENTEYLALIINENRTTPLQPIVVVFFNTKMKHRVPAKVVDLQDALNTLRITRSVNPSNYDIKINMKDLLSKVS